MEKKERAVLRSTDNHRISAFHWLGDRYVLYSVVDDQIYINGFYLVDRTDLTKSADVTLFSNTAFVGAPRARPGHAILWRVAEKGDENRKFDLFEIEPGPLRKLTRAERGPALAGPGVKPPPASPRTALTLNRTEYPEPKGGAILGFRSDAAGELALCSLYLDHHPQALLFNSTRKTWEKLDLDPEETGIMLVEPDHAHLWVNEYTRDQGFTLCRLEVATGRREPPVVTDPDYNLGHGRIFYSHVTGRLAGISYERQRHHSVWLVPAFATAQDTLDAQFPGMDNVLVDFDDAEKKFLFLVTGDRQPDSYYLLDITTGTLTPAGQPRPWLKGVPLRPTQPIQFTARDGLALEGYLTLPAGADASHPAPLVVLCHGGPHSRDLWGFDPEVQFLASRGYAVLQPNYRGSTGYRPEVSFTPRYDFRRMHDDVTDATRAISRMEMIDRNRIAIMGGSFGGYLAVAGVAFESGIYRCAVTTCGVFDWSSIVRDAKRDGRPGEYEILTDNLGDVSLNKEAFQKISPLAAAGNIKVPVFIAHGVDDNVVDVSQSRRLASALRSNSVPFETFYRNLEAHGFFGHENRLEYYLAVEKFLARHLGPPSK